MVKMNMKTAKLAAIITGAVFIVNYVLGNLLGQVVSPLFASVPTVSAVTGTVGEKMLAWIGGVIPLRDLAGFGALAIFLSALVALMLGEYLVKEMKLPTFKGKTGRLASIIMWGAVPIYLLLVGFVAPTGSTFLGVAIHAFAVSWVAGYLAGFLKVQI